MAAAIRIGRILGIPIYLHLTFLLILPLFIYIFSAPATDVTIADIPLSFRGLETDLWVKYAFGTVAALVFFGTILAHELAHSYLALRYGVKIRSITLMVFGGVSSMEELPRLPGQEWRMAFAGPFTSMVVGLISYGLVLLLRLLELDSMLLDGVVILLGLMAVYNLLLAGFNMIPAFPMDGGRVLRAYFASKMSYLEATKKAARIGRYFAIAMGIFGIFYNFFFILIALFVYIAATEEEQATTITESLQGLTVRDLMTREVEVVHPDMSVQQLHDLMLATHHMGFPVVDNGLVGIVTLSDTHKVPKDRLHLTQINDIMTRNVITVDPGEDAARALKLMSERKIGRLVVEEAGRLAGIVTQKDFLRAIDMASVRQGLARWGEQFQPPPQTPPM
ncbi:MAG: CBS domain-containing protein [Candidatus Thermoplasmatota archaeon]|nr:CBS domain-containing protein [Candidatus Thermoplasmatota archaeon]